VLHVGAHFLAVVCFALVGCTTVFDIRKTELAPANDNPRILILNNSTSQIDLVDFPLLVTLDERRIDYSRVDVPSTELRFYSPSSGQDLPFEIEEWDPAGTSYVWVLVPHIPAGSTTETLELYFGADAAGLERPRDVWAGYDLVLHGRASSFTSSTANGYVGVPTGVTSARGKIGQSFAFIDDDEEHSIECPAALLDAWPTYSLEMWIYLDYESSYGYRASALYPEPSVLTKTGNISRPLDLGRAIWEGVDTLFNLQIDENYEDASTYSQADLRLRRWSHVVLTFDGQNQWMLRDGDFADVQHLNLGVPSTTLASGPGTLLFGGRSHAMNGMLDEIRVSRAYRHPDWVQAQYLSMTDRFITYPLPAELL
jgi:hypothetical protein